MALMKGKSPNLENVSRAVREMSKLRDQIGTPDFLRALGEVTRESPVKFSDFPTSDSPTNPNGDVPILKIGRLELVTKRTSDGSAYTSVNRGLGTSIVAVTRASNGELNVVLTQQLRGAADLVFPEIPGGIVNPNETVLASVVRELREETGYTIQGLIAQSANQYSGPGFTTDRQKQFIVEASLSGDRDRSADDAGEIRSVAEHSLKEVSEEIAEKGTMLNSPHADTKSMLGVLRAGYLQLIGKLRK